VAYAGVAYTSGITVYFWGFASIGIGVGIGSCSPAAGTGCVRSSASPHPLEYLAKRYNIPTQQALAWSVSLLKIFDIAAKWYAVATLLNVFAEVPYVWGIVIIGSVTLIYCTAGGLWADALTDFAQFVIQALAAIVMIWVILGKLGGVSGALDHVGATAGEPRQPDDAEVHHRPAAGLRAGEDAGLQRRHVGPGAALHGSAGCRVRPAPRRSTCSGHWC
jgi:Na+/proline symporter